MRLARLGASFPTRLSFLRVLIRALNAENAQVTRPVWKINDKGFGHAVYSVTLGGHSYSLVAFTQDLPPDQRTDRVIATAWDAAFVLFDGVPERADLVRLKANAPKQEAGRFAETDLVLSRANKSVRLFDAVIGALKAGAQPDAAMIRDIGYLMRTTAVYGNGKFGIADRGRIENRPVLSGPFMAEMLTVWLIRGFTHDLVEHIGGAQLDRRSKRHLGIGNSTGLGMAPFLVSHPILLNNWILARETALARACAAPTVDAPRAAALMDRVSRHLAEWNVPDSSYTARIARLRAEWAMLAAQADWTRAAQPGSALLQRTGELSPDTQELAAALLLELNGPLVDGLADCMTASDQPRLDPATSVETLRRVIEDQFGWALKLDFNDPAQTQQFWYVSEEKLEPRLGQRHAEPGAELESPLDVARQVLGLYQALDGQTGHLASFLLDNPQHRYAARRVQAALTHPYSEIQDNLIAGSCLPIDMLRAKLAFFGASRFDPKSDRWTRITLAQGAPLFDEISNADADDWWLPVFDA